MNFLRISDSKFAGHSFTFANNNEQFNLKRQEINKSSNTYTRKIK